MIRIWGFHGRARSFTLLGTQVLFTGALFKQSEDSVAKKQSLSQLTSLTANKSTNTNAPVLGPRRNFLLGFPHLEVSPYFAKIISTLNFLFCISYLLFKDIPRLERGLSHKKKGYALNPFRIMGTSKLWRKDFVSPKVPELLLQSWPKTGSITIIWEFVRNANAWAPTWTYWARVCWG